MQIETRSVWRESQEANILSTVRTGYAVHTSKDMLLSRTKLRCDSTNLNFVRVDVANTKRWKGSLMFCIRRLHHPSSGTHGTMMGVQQ